MHLRCSTAIDRIHLPQGSWAHDRPGPQRGPAIGAAAARTHRYEIGVSQQEVIDEALAAIADGSAEVVLVVGGEARRYERTAGPEAGRRHAAPRRHRDPAPGLRGPH